MSLLGTTFSEEEEEEEEEQGGSDPTFTTKFIFHSYNVLYALQGLKSEVNLQIHSRKDSPKHSSRIQYMQIHANFFSLQFTY